MSTLNRLAVPGEIIILRTRVLDETSEWAVASGMSVSIYPPNTSVSGLVPANAWLVSGVPTYKGDGIYEYDWTIPSNAPGGIWIDLWAGQLPYQTISGLCMF